jgi:hypothetical protein
MADKLRKMFSYVGVRDEVLPGIRFAFIPVWALTLQFRQQLLELLGLPQSSNEVAYAVIAITTVAGSVVLWAWGGYVLDPIYDGLYRPGGPWTSPGRKWLFFSSGYDLDQFRTEARTKLAAENPIYADPEQSIYKPIVGTLKKESLASYQVIEAELENSKAFRSAVLPLLVLAIVYLLNRSWSPALVATLAFVAVLELSFRYRANHALEAYRWFVTGRS